MAAGEEEDEEDKDRGRNHTTSHSGEGTTLLNTEATQQKQHTTQNHNIVSSVAISVQCYLHWCWHLIFPAILHRCSHPALFHCLSLLGQHPFELHGKITGTHPYRRQFIRIRAPIPIPAGMPSIPNAVDPDPLWDASQRSGLCAPVLEVV